MSYLDVLAVEAIESPQASKNRDKPMSGYPCIVCGRECRQGAGHYAVWLHGGGGEIVTEAEGNRRDRDVTDPLERTLDMGCYPLGKDCLRKNRQMLEPFVVGRW